MKIKSNVTAAALGLRKFGVTNGHACTGGHCAAFGPVVKDHVAALSLKPADKVMARGEGFILTAGLAPARLVGTGRYQIALVAAGIRIPLFNGHDCG